MHDGLDVAISSPMKRPELEPVEAAAVEGSGAVGVGMQYGIASRKSGTERCPPRLLSQLSQALDDVPCSAACQHRPCQPVYIREAYHTMRFRSALAPACQYCNIFGDASGRNILKLPAHHDEAGPVAPRALQRLSA